MKILAPLRITMNSNIQIDIDTKQQISYHPIILESKVHNLSINVNFYSESNFENLISFSDNSQRVHIIDITENVRKLFQSTDMLDEKAKTYYCLSDKESKCEQYSSYGLIYIRSIDEVINFPNVLIIDSTTTQVFTFYYGKGYTHIICLEGSNLNLYPNSQYTNDFYAILQENSIEMTNSFFEGKGSLTIFTADKFYIHSSTTNSNVDFSLSVTSIYSKTDTYIRALKPESVLNLKNKIKVKEPIVFHGPESLSGLFEQDRYIIGDLERVNVTSGSPPEYPYDNIFYYYDEGTYEIPVTWKNECFFFGKHINKTTLIFNDVISYERMQIDGKYTIRNAYLIIKPAKYFSLLTFPAYENASLTLKIEHDILITKADSYHNYYPDEHPTDCKIIGEGTIRFYELDYMENIKKFCQIEDSVKLEYYNKSYPILNVCTGQSNLDACKSEIVDIDNYNNVDDWVWIRNVNSIWFLRYNTSFVTDKQRTSFNYRHILTPHADFSLFSSDISLTNESINNIYAQSKSAKINIYASNGFNTGKLLLRSLTAPKNIDFHIYFISLRTYLRFPYREDFEPESIPVESLSVVYIREPMHRITGVFKKIDQVDFATNENFNYDAICYDDDPKNCYDSDFVLARNYEELLYYDNNSIESDIDLGKNITFYMNEYTFKSQRIYRNNNKNGFSIECYLPNKATIIGNFRSFEIITNVSNYFSTKTEFTIYVDDILFLNSFSSSLPTIKLTSTKNTFQIIPFTIMADLHINLCAFSVPDDITVTCPVPSVIQKFFPSTKIITSDSWTYYYTSEEGKKLLDSIPSNKFNFYSNDENLNENIVLAVGDDDVLTIPSNWSNMHNVYILHNSKSRILVDKPSNITYLLDGLILNGKFKVINGNLDIKVPQSFALNAYLPIHYVLLRYMYKVKLLCHDNIHTHAFVGFITNDFKNKEGVIIFECINSTNGLTFHLDDEKDMHSLGLILSVESSSDVNYNFDYDYICYSSVDEMTSNCNGKYFHADDITSILEAIKENPGLEISLFKDLTIPYPTGDAFLLNPSNKNISINLPDSPKSILITDDNLIIVKYEETTVIQISSQSILNVEINDNLELDIKGDTDSQITFSLGSNVLVSTKTKIDSNFTISVELNSFHLYAENANQFGTIFGDSIESLNRVCAYDSDAYSICTFDKKESIEKVFKYPFEFAEVEIALSSNPVEITLPSISEPIKLNILQSSSSVLTVGTASIVSLTPNTVTLNEFWGFQGDRKILSVKLNESSSISLVDQLTVPIVFQLTRNHSVIDLRDCVAQNMSLITIKKFDETTNEITFYSQPEIFNNFKNAISEHEGITFFRNGSKKYLCICDGVDACNKCKEGIDGRIETSIQLLSDPGEDVEIRVFSNFEASSNLFTNEHDVIIDSNCAFNLTDVKSVNQNFTDKLKVENLFFYSESNLLLKPGEPILNITLKKNGEGKHFTIELDTFLKLNIPNNDEIGVNASRLFVKGKGELNLYDYPYDKIRANEKEIKVIKGIYTICNSNAGSNFCSYSSSEYKLLANRDGFNDEFDSKSKIVVFLNSFKSDIEANIDLLHDQSILFVRKKSSQLGMLDDERQNRLRFLSTTELTSRSDLTTELGGSQGGVLLNSSDSDLFVVGFDKNLTIKQEGEAGPISNSITIQPLSDEVTIIVDESVDIEKQKIKIETKDEKTVSVTVLTNKNITDSDLLNKFIETDPEKVTVNIGSNVPEKSKNKGLQKGAIIGIAVGAAVIVLVVVAIILFIVLKKKKDKKINLSEDIDQLSDSTF